VANSADHAVEQDAPLLRIGERKSRLTKRRLTRSAGADQPSVEPGRSSKEQSSTPAVARSGSEGHGSKPVTTGASLAGPPARSASGPQERCPSNWYMPRWPRRPAYCREKAARDPAGTKQLVRRCKTTSSFFTEVCWPSRPPRHVPVARHVPEVRSPPCRSAQASLAPVVRFEARDLRLPERATAGGTGLLLRAATGLDAWRGPAPAERVSRRLSTCFCASPIRNRGASCSTAMICASCHWIYCGDRWLSLPRTRICFMHGCRQSAVARPEATQTDLETACQAANAHEFIVALPRGYDTLIGERGVSAFGWSAPASLDCPRPAERCADTGVG